MELVALSCSFRPEDIPLVDAVDVGKVLRDGDIVFRVDACQVAEGGIPIGKLDHRVRGLAQHRASVKQAPGSKRVDADAALPVRGLATTKWQVIARPPELVADMREILGPPVVRGDDHESVLPHRPSLRAGSLSVSEGRAGAGWVGGWVGLREP